VNERLQTDPKTLAMLQQRQIVVHVLQTEAATPGG
jgi:hypothetical protein